MLRASKKPVLLAFAAAAGLAALGPVLAGPGDPTPTPAPAGGQTKEKEGTNKERDELAAAIEKCKAIAAKKEGNPLVVKLDDPRIAAVGSIARAVAQEGDVKSVTRLIERLEEHCDNIFADHAVHMALREALIEVPAGSKGEVELEKRLKSDKPWTRQVALAWVMRKRPPNAASDALLVQIIKTSPKREVQGACIRALGTRRSVWAVEELIAVLVAHENDKDRLWMDARMALWEITGYDRATGKAWHQLFSDQGKAILSGVRANEPPWQLTLAGAQTKAPVDPSGKPAKAGEGGPAPGTPPPRAGTKDDHPIPGDKIVVAIDTSGSLHVRDAGPNDPPVAGPAPKTCPDCGRMHTGSFTAPKERMRLEREKVAVSLILGGLRPKSKFQLVRFDTTAKSLYVRGCMLEASEHNLLAAHDYLAPVEATGVTKMDRGLEEAFACEDMEFLYVLTDGAPTLDVPNTTDNVAFDEVVALTRILNRYRGVRIYPIGFKQSKAPLLELMAHEHHGNCVYLE